MFINNLDVGQEGIHSKSADYTTLGGAVGSLQGREALWRDLNRLEMGHHHGKLKRQVLDSALGWGNPGGSNRRRYWKATFLRYRNEILERSAAERDLEAWSMASLM